MITEQQIEAVSKHTINHKIGFCMCPCLEVVEELGRMIATEKELMQKIGSVSPLALTALIGADISGLDDGP